MEKVTKVVKVFVGGSELPFSFDLDEWNEKQIKLFKENYFKHCLELHGSEGETVYINIRRIDAVQIEEVE